MKAIVSMVVGDKYISRFHERCRVNWEAYAVRHGLDLVVFEEPLDQSPKAEARSPAWQKCLAVTSNKVKGFEQVAWMDSDILISPAAPNIFDSVPTARIGAVRDFVYPTPKAYRQRLALLETRWSAQGATVVSALTPEAYYKAFGLPPLSEVAQTGVLVLCPKLHAGIFRKTYEQYEDRGTAAFHYEMRPLSYEIVTSGSVSWLDPRFNMVPTFGMQDEFLDDLTTPYRPLDRVGIKLELALSARQRRIKRGYRQLFQESYFLHFAGRQHEMFLL